MNLLTEHFNIWAAAQTSKTKGGRGKKSDSQSPHGIKKLRELILELAVRGKLVPQDPNDEPASVLLGKIAQEKARLIKEGKIKKQKKLPEIREEESPFGLPEGWKWVRLGYVGNIFNGNSISARVKEDKYTNIDEGMPFIATKDVGYGWEELEYDNGVSIPIDEQKFKVAHKGSVLICAEGGSAGRKCGIANQGICFGNKLFANNLYGNIEPRYILANYLSPMFFYQFSEKMTGIIGGISAAKFSQILVPIPPLAEQRRIVAKVDELMALCDQLEQQQTDSNATHQTLLETLLATLTNAADHDEFTQAWQRIANHFDALFTTEQSIDQLKQTILQLAVMGKLVPQNTGDEPASVLLEKITAEKARLTKEGKIKKQKKLSEICDDEKTFQLPESWGWHRLGNIAELINGDRGKNYPNKSEYVNSGVAFINTGHIDPYGTLSKARMNYITRKKYDSLRSGKIVSGDLVYCLRGATFGKTASVEGFEEGAIASSLVIIRSTGYMDKRYLYYFFISPFGQSLIKRFDNGSAQPNLSANSVKQYVMPVAPIREQHRIVSKIDELMAICDAFKSHLTDAQTIRNQLADTVVDQVLG